jgi:hypothetical protein
MKPSTLFRFAAVGLTLLGPIMGAMIACGGDDNSSPEAGPPAETGGGLRAVGADCTKGGQCMTGLCVDKKCASTSTKKDSGIPDSSGEDVVDSAVTDTGTDVSSSCTSDSSLCSSCVSNPDASDAKVQINACSSAVGHCLPFTTPVPANAP